MPVEWLPLGPIWVAAVSGTVATEETYAKVLAAFARGAGTEPAAITVEHVAAYKAALLRKGLSPRTVRHRLSVLSSFFTWCIATHRLPGPNPVDAVKLPKVGRSIAGRSLTDTQLLALLKACRSARDRALVLLMADGGLRASETIGLCQKDFAFLDAGATVTVRRGKGGKVRQVEIPYRAAEAVAEYAAEDTCPEMAGGHARVGGRAVGPSRPLLQQIGGQEMSYRNLYRIVVDAGLRAGLGHVTPHDLRRTYITRRLDEGDPLPAVQQAAGHSLMEQTARYYRGGGENMNSVKQGFPEQQRDAESA